MDFRKICWIAILFILPLDSLGQLDSANLEISEEVSIQIVDTSKTENLLIANFDAHLVLSDSLIQGLDELEIIQSAGVVLQFSIKDVNVFHSVQVEIAIVADDKISIVYSNAYQFSQLVESSEVPNSYEIVIDPKIYSEQYLVTILTINSEGATSRVLTKNISL